MGRIEVPTQQNLNSVLFTDSLTGWAVGDYGVIINTLGGGISWTVQNSTTLAFFSVLERTKTNKA